MLHLFRAINNSIIDIFICQSGEIGYSYDNFLKSPLYSFSWADTTNRVNNASFHYCRITILFKNNELLIEITKRLFISPCLNLYRIFLKALFNWNKHVMLKY